MSTELSNSPMTEQQRVSVTTTTIVDNLEALVKEVLADKKRDLMERVKAIGRSRSRASSRG
jgi:hypothetical protein